MVDYLEPNPHFHHVADSRISSRILHPVYAVFGLHWMSQGYQSDSTQMDTVLRDCRTEYQGNEATLWINYSNFYF